MTNEGPWSLHLEHLEALSATESAFIDDDAARQLLYTKRYRDGPIPCPVCRSPQVYHLAEGRHRCARCHHTFGTFTGTWLARSRLPPATWLLLVRSFACGLTVRQAVQASKVSYPTALRTFTIIQHAIVASEATTAIDRTPFIPRAGLIRANAGRVVEFGGTAIPVFGVRERDSYVSAALLMETSPEWLLQQPVRKVRRGGLVYTDQYLGCDTLAFYGYPPSNVPARGNARFTRSGVYVDRAQGFWGHVKAKLLKHHRVSPAKFPLYLYEMKFRYNHRHDDIFDLVLEILVKSTGVVPDA